MSNTFMTSPKLMFTYVSVTEGHPDKICDQVSDAVLDACLEQDTALSFVMTTLAAKLFLHEQVNGLRWSGVALIVLGAALISYGEHSKPRTSLPAHTKVTSPQ